jgi:hypothetical protein
MTKKNKKNIVWAYWSLDSHYYINSNKMSVPRLAVTCYFVWTKVNRLDAVQSWCFHAACWSNRLPQTGMHAPTIQHRVEIFLNVVFLNYLKFLAYDLLCFYTRLPMLLSRVSYFISQPKCWLNPSVQEHKSHLLSDCPAQILIPFPFSIVS